MDKGFLESISFPYATLREGQDRFIEQVYTTIEQQKNLLVSAPTGLGKTVSALAPALALGKKLNKTVVCLTSRQTQVNQIIKTIKDIHQVSGASINYVAFIGKRHMCVHPDRDLYPPGDFLEFCKKTREQGKCIYYKNAKNEEYQEQIQATIDHSAKQFMNVEQFVEFTGANRFCPYEMAATKAYQADLVICDYNYLFISGIREGFLGKIGRMLEECILVVDEAHNLPDRIRNAHTYTLSTEQCRLALKELQDFVKGDEYDTYVTALRQTMEDMLYEKLGGDQQSFLLGKRELVDAYLGRLSSPNKVENIVEELKEVEQRVREDRIVSHVGRLANFLERWMELGEESFLRVLEKEMKPEQTLLSLKIRCIDPAPISGEIINTAYASISMSATLSPIEMYRDLLALDNAELLELDSPFAKEHQMTLVTPDVTSKYSARSPSMYALIAQHLERVLNAAEGRNALVFFPSYDFMNNILGKLPLNKLDRQVLKEQKQMTKEEKERYIATFKETGGLNQRAKVLFAVTSGSFAEGLDLPEELLELVVVVGLPLAVPDIYTQAVIDHFDKKFNKGQLYGYIYPAMTKIIQAAGRCIRTENDKGVVVLMDHRFLWPFYGKAFPKHWHLLPSKEPEKDIESFFF